MGKASVSALVVHGHRFAYVFLVLSMYEYSK